MFSSQKKRVSHHRRSTPFLPLSLTHSAADNKMKLKGNKRNGERERERERQGHPGRVQSTPKMSLYAAKQQRLRPLRFSLSLSYIAGAACVRERDGEQTAAREWRRSYYTASSVESSSSRRSRLARAHTHIYIHRAVHPGACQRFPARANSCCTPIGRQLVQSGESPRRYMRGGGMQYRRRRKMMRATRGEGSSCNSTLLRCIYSVCIRARVGLYILLYTTR